MKWLPNCVTLIRIFIAPVIAISAYFEKWPLASLLLAVALLTDWLDGFLAIKLNAQSKLGSKLDGAGDFLTATSGILGLGLGHCVSWFALFIVALGALALALIQGVISWDASKKFIRFTSGRVDGFLSFYAIAIGIGTAGTYLVKAFGMQVLWLIPVAIPAGVIAASVKRHRIRAWCKNNKQCLAK